MVADASVPGGWRAARFFEGDSFGVTGDFLRPQAAYYLYCADPSWMIITSGSQGNQASVPNIPTTAAVNAAELQRLGVPREAITLDDEGDNTYEELRHLQHVIENRDFTNVQFITNRWHVARVSALIDHDKKMAIFYREHFCQILDAESVVCTFEGERWRGVIERAYESPQMLHRLAVEAQGQQQLEAGTYKLVSRY